MKPVYEELDYLLVPTYFPVLVLLLRAESLLLLYEVARGVMHSAQILNAVLCILLYLDSILVHNRRSFDVYIGGILPVALALVTNGIMVREDVNTGRQDLWHLAVDATWAALGSLSVYVTVCMRQATTYCYACLLAAFCCGVMHIVILDGYYSTTLSTFMCRIVVFYVLGLCVYSMRMQHSQHGLSVASAVPAVAHRYCTLHAAVPALFLHEYVLSIYVALLFISSLLCHRKDRKDHKDHKDLKDHKDRNDRNDRTDSSHTNDRSDSVVPSATVVDARSLHAGQDATKNNSSEGANVSADASLIKELLQAKKHIATAQQFGFV